MRRPSSHLSALAALLALAPVGACTCSTEAPVEETVSIDQLSLTVAPVGAATDGRWVVAPRSTLRLDWSVSGDAGRVVFAAGERVLATSEGAGAGTFTDDCAVEGAACLTAEEGPILFTLTVLGKGDDTTSSTESLQVEVRAPPAPLAIETFTADDLDLTFGASTTIRLLVTGAQSLELSEGSCDGETARTLAPTTTEFAIQPSCTTMFRLEAFVGTPDTAGFEAVQSEGLLVVVHPTATLSSSVTQAAPGAFAMLSFTSGGARFAELTFDGAPVDLDGRTVEADSVVVTIPADATVGERLVATFVAYDAAEADAEVRYESAPATVELEVVAP